MKSTESVRSRAARLALAPALIAIATLAEPSHASAQEAGLVLESPASTAAMAWGNAPYLFSSSSDLLFYAPALIGRTDGFTVGAQRFDSEGTRIDMSGAGSVGLGDFAVGVQYFRYEADGLASAQDFQSVALTPGVFGVTELAASLGYAREIFGIDAGIVVKYVEQSYDEIDDGSLAVDFGVATDIGPTMVNLTLRNLGRDIVLPTPPCVEVCPAVETELDLPTNIALGISTEDFQVGELDMFLTSQLLRRRDGEIIPAGGLELSYWPVQGYTFRARAGVQRVVEDDRSPFTFGLAFTGDALTFEYAFQSFDGEGDAHRFGLSIR